jgi:hypothetical protein
VNTCFLIPIHPPKYALAYNLLKSYNSLYSDKNFYFIFTNQTDLKTFENLYHDIEFKYIICDKFFGEGIINFKKIYGLNYIFNNTDYDAAAVIDCDSIFVKKVDYNSLFLNKIKSKKIFASASYNKYIATSCLKFFANKDVEKILKNIKIDEIFLYFWFNEIPLYSRKNFLDFYEYLNLKTSIHRLAWADFDYIIYIYYLLTQNKIKIEILNSAKITQDSYVERTNLITHDMLKNFKLLNPLWLPNASNLTLLNKKELQIFKNVFIKFHLC